MFDRKKTAAFIAGMLICAYAAVPAINAFADEDFLVEGATEASTSKDTYTKSGDFMYSLTHDGKVCIEDCTSTAENLVIPDTLDGIAVTELGRSALGSDHENNTFKTVTIPASVTYISADNPFVFCTNLTEIKVAEGSADFCAEDGILYNKDKTEIICYPCCKKGDSFAIPETVKKVGASAFYNTIPYDIKMPASLEKVEHFAFANTRLGSADFSGTKLEYLSDYAFTNCSHLKEIKLPDTVEHIGGGTFAGCGQLEEITLPEKLQTIGQYAFFDTGLTEAVIPDSVTSIGYCAFGYYTSASGQVASKNEAFTIVGRQGGAASVYAHDKDSDYDYQNSFSFMTPEEYEEKLVEEQALNSTKSGDYEYAVIDGEVALTFCYSQEDKITVPDTIDGKKVDAIYTNCFNVSCPASEIIIPEGIKELKRRAFYQCGNLKKITTPASVKTIGDNAFDECKALESVEFLGAETIGNQIFRECSALKTVKADGCLKEWNDEEPFLYAIGLEDITITEGDGNFSSENGVLYNKDKSVLIAYPPAKTETEFIAPKGLKEIAQSAFIRALNLKKVEIPEADVINAYAFEGCENLTEVKLSDSLTTLGADAFYNCNALKSLHLPDTLVNIGTCAFGYYHDENADTENGAPSDILVEGFKLYTVKDCEAYNYAKSAGIEVITGTTEILGKNVSKGFLYTVGGIIAAFILGIIGVFTGKKIKKSKAEKEAAEKREKTAERRKKRQEEENEDTDKEEDSLEDDED